jgi:peptidoglycan/xylan/chitin deacetylase (PgdA/CDA1 family)
MVIKAVGGAACAAAALMAYAVRGKSSDWFAPSVYRGSRATPFIALTFDDGPCESTPEILEILGEYKAKATFFQCGANVRRLPEVARQVATAGHEIGNHSDTHSRFYFRRPDFIYNELLRAQNSIHEITGVTPSYLRVPYGARWFGLRQAQRRLGLLGVMWTEIGLDWKLQAEDIMARISGRISNGAIVCLHDGRELRRAPNIRQTVEAVRLLLPAMLDRGFQFVTISSLLCPTT